MPWATTRSKAAARVLTSCSRPYSFSGISNRSGTVVLAQREGGDVALSFPFRQAPTKISLEADSGLVAFFDGLSQKPRHNRRELCGDLFINRLWLARNLAVDPFHSIGGSKWQAPRERLVQSDAQGVEIAARINRAIDPTGLFGGHIGEGARNDLRRHGHLTLARNLGRNPKPVSHTLPSSSTSTFAGLMSL